MSNYFGNEDYQTLYEKYRAIPHKSARESGERFFIRKRCKTAGILCVFQGFTNVFLAKKIRQNPQTHLCGVALGSFRQAAVSSRRQTIQVVLPPIALTIDLC